MVFLLVHRTPALSQQGIKDSRHKHTSPGQSSKVCIQRSFPSSLFSLATLVVTGGAHPCTVCHLYIFILPSPWLGTRVSFHIKVVGDLECFHTCWMNCVYRKLARMVLDIVTLAVWSWNAHVSTKHSRVTSGNVWSTVVPRKWKVRCTLPWIEGHLFDKSSLLFLFLCGFYIALLTIYQPEGKSLLENMCRNTE